MLVLARRECESIRIGDIVKLTVLQIRGDVVRIGFEALEEVPIWREEIWQTLERPEKEGE